MRFSEIVVQAIDLLRGSGRLTYAALKREFELDDSAVADLAAELIEARRVAYDENGRVLVWCGDQPSPASTGTPVTQVADAASEPEGSSYDAGRRQITVAFCDLVGSTALSEALDGEDLADLMQAYQASASAVFERYQGHVAQFLGDGLMVYFGWPRAHEDDAQRALRACLEVVQTVKRVPAPKPLQVRIGVATGQVVVPEEQTGGEHTSRLAVGETPNVASRMQDLANADEIVIAPLTRRLAAGVFEYEDLGERSLKGIEGTVRIWKLLGERDVEGPFQARGGSTLTPFVGRETELTLLMERWARVRESEGQVVVLSGEAGIGKSRVTEVLRERLMSEPHVRIRYQCSPYHASTAFHPILDQLKRAAGFDRDDDTAAKLDKLEALLAPATENLDAVAPLFANMLSLPADRYPAVTLNPERLKERTVEALIEQTEGLARERPLLMIFEDVHWIDPTSLAVLDAVVRAIPELPVLVVVTCRPEFEAAWSDRHHVTVHSLNRLSRAQGATIVDELTRDHPLPAEMLKRIIARTDGVPLFVEELTKSILDAGLNDASRSGAGQHPTEIIPSTLHDSLMARLDRLRLGKSVAQIGACLGRAFDFDLVRAVTDADENELLAGVGELVEAGLVYRRGGADDDRFVFKHALVQDTAYQSLLKSARQQLHARIADALAEVWPDTVEQEPEIMAVHSSAAGRVEAAVRYWLKAGERAVERSANLEAVRHLTNGLDLIPSLGEAQAEYRLELALQAQLGPALIATAGYGAPETARCFERALELAHLVPDSPLLFPALYGCFVYKLTWAEFPTARDMAGQLLELARTHDDTAAVLTGHRIMGFSLSCLGRFEEARMHFERVESLYQPGEHAALAYQYSSDPRASGGAMLGWNLWHLGFPDKAVRVCDEAIDYAKELQHANTLGYVETFGAARIHLFRRDVEAVRRHVESMTTLCEEHGLVFWLGFIEAYRGWLLAEEGDGEAAVETIRNGMAALEHTHTAMFRPLNLALLAHALLVSEQLGKARDALEDAMATAERTSESWIVPELHRLLGDVTLAWTGASKARLCYEHALSSARELGARGWELRAATSLGRLLQSQDELASARAVVEPVYARFEEGLDTRDLDDARTLLTACQ